MTRIVLVPDVDAICKKLGVNPTNVRSITLNPDTAEVTEYILNEQGDKHIIHETGRAATETRTYKIRT